MNTKILIKITKNNFNISSEDFSTDDFTGIKKCLNKHIDWARLKNCGYVNGKLIFAATFKDQYTCEAMLLAWNIAYITSFIFLAIEQKILVELINDTIELSYEESLHYPKYKIQIISFRDGEHDIRSVITLIQNPIL